MIKNVEITKKPQTSRGVLIEEEHLSLICELYDFVGFSVNYRPDGSAQSVIFDQGRGAGNRERPTAKFGQVLVKLEGTPFRDYMVLDIQGDSEIFEFEIVDPNG